MVQFMIHTFFMQRLPVLIQSIFYNYHYLVLVSVIQCIKHPTHGKFGGFFFKWNYWKQHYLFKNRFKVCYRCNPFKIFIPEFILPACLLFDFMSQYNMLFWQVLGNLLLFSNCANNLTKVSESERTCKCISCKI